MVSTLGRRKLFECGIRNSEARRDTTGTNATSEKKTIAERHYVPPCGEWTLLAQESAHSVIAPRELETAGKRGEK